jgi:hypothetical protein
MPTRRIGTHDQETGELLEGVAVWIGRKLASPYGRQWMQVNQDALAEIAADRDIGLEAWRVFAYLNARLDFENLIVVPQGEIVAALSMKRSSISRAVKLLTDKQIILRGPKIGSVSSYRLNPHYGWKGKVQNLTKARQKRLQVVAADGRPGSPGRSGRRALAPPGGLQRAILGSQRVFGPSDHVLTSRPRRALQCITVQPGEAMTVQVTEAGAGRPRPAVADRKRRRAWRLP